MAPIAATSSQTLDDAQGKRAIWHSASKNWRKTYWLVGSLGLVFSTLSAASGVAGPAAPYFAALATICYGFVGFANPQKLANNHFYAYFILDTAIRRYLDGDAPVAAVREAMETGDRYLMEGGGQEAGLKQAAAPPAIPQGIPQGAAR